MKQIKTVIVPISSTTRFDTEVNQLLYGGWKLKKRKIIDTAGEISDSFNFPLCQFLYAELEKEKAIRFEEVTL